MNTQKIALFGFGTVGGGVGKILWEQQQEIQQKTGNTVEIVKIAIKSFEETDLQSLPKEIFTENHSEIFENSEIETVVELIGGTGIAKTVIEKALCSGKNVITANKALIAEHGEELLEIAKKNTVKLLFEASIAGGIPVVGILRKYYGAGQISKISGIMNGTCNYIATELEKGGKSYEEVLQDAQEKGFAEADPTFDVEAYDATQKLALLTSLAFGITIPEWKKIARTGVSQLKSEDFEFAKKMKKRIRLIAKAEFENGKLLVGVHPRMIDKTEKLAQIMGPENAIVIEDQYLGKIALTGPGAGSFPTAMAVIADIMELFEKNTIPEMAFLERKNIPFATRETIKKEFYLRIFVQDQAGVLAKITGILAEEKISINELTNAHGEKPLAFLLHKSPITAVEEAVQKISQLDFVQETPLLLPLE